MTALAVSSSIVVAATGVVVAAGVLQMGAGVVVPDMCVEAALRHGPGNLICSHVQEQ